MPDYRGILFDKDGTLFDFTDSWAGWATRLIADLAGGDAVRARLIGHLVGFDSGSRSFAPDSMIIAGTPDDIAGVLVPHLPGWSHGRIVDHANALAQSLPLTSPVPLVPLIERLRHEGLRLGLATNDGAAPALAHARQAGIRHLPDFIAGSDSGFGAKPAPGMLLAFCRETGLEPSQVVMVGDSIADMQAGRAAGMAAVAVLSGPAGRAELAPYADAVLPDIGALPAWLGLEQGRDGG